MAYMSADTNAKVGYRPYLQTNPRRAAMLSGVQNITGLGQSYPFDPWRLHGLGELGQNRPFDQNPGGWELHGLSGLALSGLDGVMDMDPSSASDPATASAISNLQHLVNQGLLTSDEADAVFSGTLSLPDALNQAASRAPGPAAAAWSPTGAQLLYTVSWTAGVSNLLTSADGAIGKLTQLLPQYGMSVKSSQVDSGGPIHYGFHVAISDNVGHAAKADVLGVLNSLMQQIVGTNLGGSDVAVVAAPGTPGGAGAILPSGAGADALTWMEGNWQWLAVAAGILIVLGPASRGLFGGRR
jgi:hypothetical protein